MTDFPRCRHHKLIVRTGGRGTNETVSSARLSNLLGRRYQRALPRLRPNRASVGWEPASVEAVLEELKL